MFPPVPRNVWLRNIPPLYFAFSNLLVDFCFVLKKKKRLWMFYSILRGHIFHRVFFALISLRNLCAVEQFALENLAQVSSLTDLLLGATFGFFVFLCSCYASQTRLTDKSRNDTDGPTASFSYPARRFIYSNDRRRRKRHRALL